MKILRMVMLAVGLVVSVHLLHGQIAPFGISNNDLGPVQSASPDPADSIVQLTADAQGLQLLSPDQIPFSGTFWTIVPGPGTMALPFPCPPPGVNLPTYSIADGVYLVDDTATTNAVTQADLEAQATTVVNLIGQVQTAAGNQQSPMMARAMGDGVPFPSGGGTNSYSPDDLTNNFVADYGTNLWLEITSISNVWVNLLVSNTVSDVKYEIDGTTNLTPAVWNFEGFLYGSELTNWTPTSIEAFNLTNNLFLQVRSWQDDGSGLPIWWQMQYFGYYGVDPNADPAGDGWSNIQKFQNGMSPNLFYTPPAPHGVTVIYNTSTDKAIVSWLPSPGAVTGYTVTDSDGHTYTVSASTFTLVDDISSDMPDGWYDNDIGTTINVQANYSAGNSAIAGPIPVEQTPIAASLVPGPQGTPYLAVSALPPNTAAVRLTEFDYFTFYWGDGSTSPYITNFDIPVSQFSNGLFALPNIVLPSDGNDRQNYGYQWYGQAVGTNGHGLTMTTQLRQDFVSSADGWMTSWMVPPFVDGRVQLKQNLIFQLRAALADHPFQYAEFVTNDPGNWNDPYFFTSPTNYAYASFYYINNYGYGVNVSLDTFQPFIENNFDRNFVLNGDYDNTGRLTTGIDDHDTHYFYGGSSSYYVDELDIQVPSGINPGYQPSMLVGLPYQFELSNATNIPAVLDAADTRWLASSPLDGSPSPDWARFGASYDSTNGIVTLANNSRNWFGLTNLSVEIATNGPLFTTLYAGSSTGDNGYLYPETAQPQLKTVEYDYWPFSTYGEQNFPEAGDFPGIAGLYVNHTNSFLVTSVGNASFQLACFAKMAVTNGYPGAYGFLGQYFAQAYQIDTNGTTTTNTTGVLSPYGAFLATQPGPAALVTMPDIDTSEQGTCTVYAVSLAFDVNHDGAIDTSFGGPDNNSVSSPYVVWANNNYDRGHTVDGTDFEQDDLGPVDVGRGGLVPDCQYITNGYPAIPCTRDLQDYFRLWTPGISAVLAAAPTNYTVQITLTGTGQIRIFQASEANGGTNYLFDEAMASNQVANSASLYVGLLTSNLPVILNDLGTEHFIFCGARIGSAQLDLQVLDGNGNVVADAPAYLQINDIKQMYERFTVGDVPTNTPLTVAVMDASDLPTNPPVSAFQYTAPQTTNIPYILFIHGWNMERWEKDRFAESEFKRLYWQGYQGRFGSFRWPTGHDFGGIGDSWDNPITDPRNFDNSEFTAWQSATGLTNLLTQLNAEYPGHVFLTAHSMGNVVAGEALRKLATPIVNTYIAMQAAVASQAYDPTTPTRSLVYLGVNLDDGTPNCYADYYTNGAPSYFNDSIGAENYVNFFNTNDYALNVALWQLNQDLKPDNGLPYPGYHYSSSSGFYRINGLITTYLNFPSDTHEIFAYGDEARCYALGGQANVGGPFKVGVAYKQIDLGQLPYNFAGAHKFHSGEFRSDNAQRAAFWNAILVQMKLK